ncbi:hypothetical protein AWT69_003689 [Pseudomonas putida]|nr:hypothetical protein AWT69_003689 [Pseudomonas putida]
MHGRSSVRGHRQTGAGRKKVDTGTLVPVCRRGLRPRSRVNPLPQGIAIFRTGDNPVGAGLPANGPQSGPNSTKFATT